MKNRLYRYLKVCLLLVFSFIIVTACHSKNTQQANIPETRSQNSDCRMIVHQFGKTCVPLNAQRVIVTDEIALDAVLGLDVKPIATAEPNIAGKRGRQLKGKAEGVTSLGKGSQINIEKIAELNPDLIVGFFMNLQQYELFSQIAPTVKLELEYLDGTWKDSLLKVAEILDRIEQAQNAIALYEQRVIKLRKAIEEQLGDVTVSVIRFYADKNVQFDTIFSFAGTIFEEAGISAPPQQLPFATNKDVFSVSISLEKLELIDGDVLFVMLDPDSEDNFQRYQGSPLWQKLNVVQHDHVYTVDSGYWYLGNIMAANAILDDLEQYLFNSFSIS
ncbi:Iron siderophore-binding protein [Hyella patelloides LEGE 07179]|uniref:Iron siderophore-binding protein n=1 Tax=Hyella patelloides LEGE 07179 TaxID=945734 RepID=A0A563VNR4_9CYAN|nr:iron-siderophore ABC transporter substrate-binding protein [Hyella patelloides]VEP12973.1 Iron siderophore-binding protein [Hyella patelloides LEGE 07179]